MKLYINGELNSSSQTAFTIDTNAQELLIGSTYGTHAMNTSGELFNGSIDEVSLWSRTLTETEINNLYQSTFIDNAGEFTSRIMDTGGDAAWTTINWTKADSYTPTATRSYKATPDGPYRVHPKDIDGDGDIDFATASYIDDTLAWYENDGSENFTIHTLTTALNGARGNDVIDLDQDGDMDILGASQLDDEIFWYENDGSQNFTEKTISLAPDAPFDIHAIDVDDDGDIDVVAAEYNGDKISWYENDGAENFTEHSIVATANGANYVYAMDIDGDNDIDFMSSSRNDDLFAWYENDGAENFTQRTVEAGVNEARFIYGSDLDQDGDVDLIGGYDFAAPNLTWYENDGSEVFTPRAIASTLNSVASAYPVDYDRDGDLDLIVTAKSSSDLTLMQNDGNQNFTEIALDGGLSQGLDGVPVDLDQDGDWDVLVAAYLGDDIIYYENSTPEATLKFQARSCDDGACSGESFIGPDGTSATYYTGSGQTLSAINNQYFQYKAFLTSSDGAVSPQVQSVTINPTHYDAGNPTIVNSTGQVYSALAGFTETLGGSNAGTIEYQLSNNGTNWYYWNGANWVTESGSGYPTQTTNAATTNTNIAAFTSDVGTGNFFFKAYLNSALGAQVVELDSIDLDYTGAPNASPNTPTHLTPTNGAQNLNLTPTLTSSVFSDTDGGDTHANSQWIIRALTDPTYATPVYYSSATSTALTSLNIPSGTLAKNTIYFWQTSHQDNNGAWSATSTETAFSTGLTPVSLVSVGATEYTAGETARLTIQVRDADGSAINSATATVDIYNPASTKVVTAASMTYLTGSNGLYYYDYTIPATLGVYIYDANAVYSGETGYTSHTFHVAQFASDITDIKSDVSAILIDTSTTLDNKINNLETQINTATTTLTTEINANETKIDDLDSDIASASTSITNLLNANTTNIITEINANETKIDLLQTDITYIRSKVDSIFTDTQLLRTATTNILNKWGSTDADSLSAQISVLESYIGTSTNPTTYLTLFGKINAIQEKWGTSTAIAIYNAANNAYNSAESARDELDFRGKATTAYQDIQSVLTYTDSLESDLSTLTTNLATHETAQAIARATLSATAASTTDIQTKVTDTQTKTTDIQSNVNAISASTTDIQTRVIDTQTKTTDIQSNMDILIGAFIVTQSTVNDASASATSFVTNLTNATDDFYNNAVLTFTSGTLNGQNRRISDYNGSTKALTLDPALTSAPANSSAFTIITQNVRNQEQITIHETAQALSRSTIDAVAASTTDIQTKTNTLISEIGSGNISAIKTSTDTINWSDIAGIVTSSGLIKAKTDTIDWANVTAIKTKTDTIDWANVTTRYN